MNELLETKLDRPVVAPPTTELDNLPKFLDRRELKETDKGLEYALPFDLDDDEEVFVQTEEEVGPTVH